MYHVHNMYYIYNVQRLFFLEPWYGTSRVDTSAHRQVFRFEWWFNIILRIHICIYCRPMWMRKIPSTTDWTEYQTQNLLFAGRLWTRPASLLLLLSIYHLRHFRVERIIFSSEILSDRYVTKMKIGLKEILDKIKY